MRDIPFQYLRSCVSSDFEAGAYKPSSSDRIDLSWLPCSQKAISSSCNRPVQLQRRIRGIYSTQRPRSSFRQYLTKLLQKILQQRLKEPHNPNFSLPSYGDTFIEHLLLIGKRTFILGSKDMSLKRPSGGTNERTRSLIQRWYLERRLSSNSRP